ncbi:hypothetical protein [Variovorax sp. B2]
MEMNVGKAKALNVDSVAEFVKHAKANPGADGLRGALVVRAAGAGRRR